MKLDRLIRLLLPRKETFYILFQQDAVNLLAAAKLLKELVQAVNPDERRQKIKEIKEAELQGDEITHQIFLELSSTFVTPMDREDIHVLASAIDDILDHIEGVSTRVLLYKVEKFSLEMAELVDIIYKSSEELNRAIPLLQDMRDLDAIRDVCVKINSYENEADRVFHEAIARIFTDVSDPIEVIKTKEILAGLETATDKLEDAANILETLVSKHA